MSCAARPWLSASDRRSMNSVRFGRPVSGSCSAWRASPPPSGGARWRRPARSRWPPGTRSRRARTARRRGPQHAQLAERRVLRADRHAQAVDGARAGAERAAVRRGGDRGAQVRAEHGPPDHHGLLQQAAEVLALQRQPPEPRDGGLLGEVALELGLGPRQALAGAVERLGGAADLGLHEVEGVRHRTDLVARAHVDGDDVDPRLGRLEVAGAERAHRARQVGDACRWPAARRRPRSARPRAR